MKYPSSSIFNRDFLLKINVRNTFEIPNLSHISMNLTSRSLVAEKKHSLFPLVGLSLLSGQQPKVLRAKKSVAAFKLKKNAIIGCQLTLRKEKMRSFLQNLALLKGNKSQADYESLLNVAAEKSAANKTNIINELFNVSKINVPQLSKVILLNILLSKIVTLRSAK